MDRSQPNHISEYYIAYFDILGYQEFFKESPEKAQDFLNVIHSVISDTLNSVKTFNEFSLFSQLANLHIYSKIFSDNILLCIETGTDIFKEKQRIIIFMELVSQIQRKFITKYKLLIRGGVTKGTLSINDDYIFGEGLIEAVKMEGSTLYPRIAVSDKVIKFLEKIQLYSQKEADRAISIENRSKNGEQVSNEDYEFYRKMLDYANQELFLQKIYVNVLYKCDDDVWCLSYLHCLDIRSFIPEESVEKLLEFMQQISPVNYERRTESFPNIDFILDTHKCFVEQKLVKYSDYSSFGTNEIKKFEEHEKILKKYVWVMVYHNYMCQCYKKLEYYINTYGNCERRHMKLVIHVLDKDNKIIN